MKKFLLTTACLAALTGLVWADDASICSDPKGDDSARLAACTRVIAKGCSDRCASVYERRGFIYYRLNEFTKSVDDFTQSLNLRTEGKAFPFTLLGRGKSYCELKRWREAISDMSAFLNSDDEMRRLTSTWKSWQDNLPWHFFDASYCRGVAYYEVGDYVKAKKDLTNVLS
jgi:tetratricopeptide (TPR) repeat protein